jgi:hypothetical protein
MERTPMFINKQNQYCENGYTTKSDLQIQCKAYQISNDILHRNTKFPMTFFTGIQNPKKTPKNQSNPQQNPNAGGITIPDFKLCYKNIVTKTV